MRNSNAAATNAFNARSLRSYTPYSSTDRHDAKRTRELNAISFQLTLDDILKIYCSRFKWDLSAFNIPNNYMEYNLFFNGVMACFEHPEYGFLIMPCTIKEYNIYNMPSKISITGSDALNSFPFDVNYPNFILIWDNPAMTTPYLTFRKYAFEISDVSRSCEVYQNGLKKPVILSGDFNKQSTLNHVVNSKLSNEYYTILDNSSLKDNIDSEIKPYFNSAHKAEDLKALYMHKQNLYDEMLRNMGIASNTIYKSAQVTSDEVNKSDLMADLVLASSFECRIEANRQIAEFASRNIVCENMIEIVSNIQPPIPNIQGNTENEDS